MNYVAVFLRDLSDFFLPPISLANAFYELKLLNWPSGPVFRDFVKQSLVTTLKLPILHELPSRLSIVIFLSNSVTFLAVQFFALI